MKGIILAGGAGSRLHPTTLAISKQMLPVYNKPMIYYPISTLISSGINEILIISTPHDISFYKKLFKNSDSLGLKISYCVQENPNGLAEAFIIGEDFIGNDPVCLILGDNIFYGSNLYKTIKFSIENTKNSNCANIFGYSVDDPERFGVAEIDNNNNVVSIEEKPSNPKSNYAIVGLYCYPSNVVKKAKTVLPSDRGELEISSLNNIYLDEKNLKINILDKNVIWFDTGTFDSMLDASNEIKNIELKNKTLVGCVEEACLGSNFLTEKELKLYLKDNYSSNSYFQYLNNLTS